MAFRFKRQQSGATKRPTKPLDADATTNRRRGHQRLPGVFASGGRALWGLFLLSVVVHLAYALWVQPQNRAVQKAATNPRDSVPGLLYGDESHYYSIAQNLLAARSYAKVDADGVIRATAERPPVYPLVLLGAFTVFGSGLDRGLALNRLLVALTVFVVYGVTFGLVAGEVNPSRGSRSSTGMTSAGDPLSRRAHLAGLIAASLTVVWPHGLFFAGNLMTEAIAAFTYTLALLATIQMTRHPTRTVATGAGVAWALVVLTRSEFMMHALFLGPWLLLARRRIPRGVTACFLVAGALSYSPWVVRNWVTFHEPILVTTAGGAVFSGAHTPEIIARSPGSWETPFLSAEEIARHPEILEDEVKADRYQWQRGLAVVRQLDVQQLGRLVVYKLARMLVPAERLVDDKVCRPCNLAMSALFLPVFGLVLIGLAYLRSRPLFFTLMTSQIAALALTAAVFWGGTRLRAPMEPALWALAAFGFVAWMERKSRAGLSS